MQHTAPPENLGAAVDKSPLFFKLTLFKSKVLIACECFVSSERRCTPNLEPKSLILSHS